MQAARARIPAEIELLFIRDAINVPSNYILHEFYGEYHLNQVE